MNELVPVTREDFTTKVYANPQWTSEPVEAPWISTMLFLDDEGAIVARARYPKSAHGEKVKPVYELGTKVMGENT